MNDGLKLATASRTALAKRGYSRNVAGRKMSQLHVFLRNEPDWNLLFFVRMWQGEREL